MLGPKDGARFYLGLDTSAYTTSVAVIDQNLNIAAQQRQILQVPSGSRGLQQSQAVFFHVQNLPTLIENLYAKTGLAPRDIAAVCASTRPRNVEGSYMPVFTVGAGFGRALSQALNAPFFETSHQEGHLRAAAWSGNMPETEAFLALHLSGGTTEILLATRQAGSINCEILGATQDLHAGQFVDRIGVALGLRFPAGPEMDRLALEFGGDDPRIPASVNGMDCHFSGGEAAALRAIQAGDLTAQQIAAMTLSCVARTLEKMIVCAAQRTGIRQILIFGGVAASGWVREQLPKRLKKHRQKIKIYFAKPEFSSDNAMGVALAGRAQDL